MDTYYFTFGYAQTDKAGVPLRNKYVKIVAKNLTEAIERMYEKCGDNWSLHYTEKEFLPLIEEFKLTELEVYNSDWDLNKMSLVDLQEKMVGHSDLKLEILENMREYGGGFVKALGACFMHADPINTRILTESFLHYVLEYQPKKWKDQKKSNS